MFSTGWLCRPRNCLNLSLRGYDSSCVPLPEVREKWRFRIKPNPSHTLRTTFSDIVSVQIGPVNLAHIPFAPIKNCSNEHNGIVKRLIHAHKLPSRKLVQEIKAFVKKEIIPFINPLPAGIPDEELREAWNADNSYTAQRKEKLKELAEQHYATYNKPTKEIMKCKMFMKDEFYEEKKHARLIISRSDTFKGIVGPYIHAFDKELFHGHFSNNFVKGKNSEWKVKRMQEIESKFPLFMETDYSSFEGSQCASIQEAIEYQVLRHFLKYYPKIWSYVEATASPSRYDYKPRKHEKRRNPFDITSKNFQLHLVGNRKSGEMWTSSGNGLTNLVIMKYLAQKKNIAWDGIVEGDDGFFGVSSQQITSEDYSELGFTIKLQYETDPNYLSFCGLRFSRCGDLVVDPENINRVGWVVKRQYFSSKKKKRLALLKAKMMSLLAEAPGCPITSTLAKTCISRIRVKEDYSDEDQWYIDWLQGEKLDYSKEVSNVTRNDFALMFGIPVSLQYAMEKSFEENCFDNFFLPIQRPHEGWMASYDEGLTGPQL